MDPSQTINANKLKKASNYFYYKEFDYESKIDKFFNLSWKQGNSTDLHGIWIFPRKSVYFPHIFLNEIKFNL